MQEKDLTEKQRHWLEASRMIGPGAMTKTERRLLEQLYADMEPRERQDLYHYIQTNFGDNDQEERGPTDKPVSDDPITRMQEKMWHEPSKALKGVLSSIPRMTPPKR